MSFEVQLNKRAERDLKNLPEDIQDQALSALEELKNNPFAGDHKKLRGSRDEHRRRIGRYRIIYTVDATNRVIKVVGVRPRKEAYR